MLPCTGLVRSYIPFSMQIVPVSSRFIQNVLQRGFVRLAKMKVSIPNTLNTHVTIVTKWRWKIPLSFSDDGWKCDDGNFYRPWLIMQKARPFSMRQSLNDDGKFCCQCYTNGENVNRLSKIISQTFCNWLPW